MKSVEDYKKIEETLREVAYKFADACVKKAIQKLKAHPDRSPTPWKSFPRDFLRRRLNEEFEEWVNGRDHTKESGELTDIGNFLAWLWFRTIRKNMEAER